MLSRKNKIIRADLSGKKLPFSLWAGKVIKIRFSLLPLSSSKFAIVTSKKTYTTKPNRNLFKRRLFSLIKQHLHKIELGPHGYFLFFPLIHISKINQLSLKEDVDAFMFFMKTQHDR